MSETQHHELEYTSPLDCQDPEAVISAASGFILNWTRGNAPGNLQRLDATDSMAYLAAALAATTGQGQIWSPHDLMNAIYSIVNTTTSLRDLVLWYAEASERNPDLFRKPYRKSVIPGQPDGLPDDVKAKRREANDQEVAEFAAEIAAGFRQLAGQFEQARIVGVQANRLCDRFYGPGTSWPVEPPKVSTALYFWYDADDVLLYIGITGDLAARQSSHAKRSSWSEFADHSKVRRYPSRPEAEAAEKAAIEAERPLFNHVHNDTPEARQRLVNYLIKHGRTDLLAPAVSRG